MGGCVGPGFGVPVPAYRCPPASRLVTAAHLALGARLFTAELPDTCGIVAHPYDDGLDLIVSAPRSTVVFVEGPLRRAILERAAAQRGGGAPSALLAVTGDGCRAVTVHGDEARERSAIAVGCLAALLRAEGPAAGAQPSPRRPEAGATARAVAQAMAASLWADGTLSERVDMDEWFDDVPLRAATFLVRTEPRRLGGQAARTP